MEFIQKSERWLQLKNLEGEIWKDIYFEQDNIIYDYRNCYQVSNYGRIKSLKRIDNIGRRFNEKIMKQQSVPFGYLFIILNNNNIKKQIYVHRLVAYMFIPNYDSNKIQINHKDENPRNNHVNNLEWCTPKYNSNYGNHRKKISDNHADFSGKNHWMYGKKDKDCHFSIKVAQISKDNKLIKIWDSQIEAYRQLNIDSRSISKCCIYHKYGDEWWKENNKGGRRKTAGGFQWYFIEDIPDNIIKKYIINNLQVPIN